MRRPYEADDDERDRDDYDHDELPLHRKRAFGSGLKRQRVEFVRATEEDETSASAQITREKGTAVSDLYASVVMTSGSGTQTAGKDPAGNKAEKDTTLICETCGLEIKGDQKTHEQSLAHQVSLQHSHPPSHLDRSRMGLQTLRSQGWDPDARVGLGSQGEGRRFPIKVALKEDTLGVGAVVPTVEKKEKEVKLTNKELKREVKREKERTKRMEREMFGRTDVEQILRGEKTGGDGLK
ncbi:uncharacterized protein F5Z01DRAFT_622174 [Emericellopsis atlantica]|uniref:G-patch domain-containing protein n=1 Tax=Emericellopsis atlantica TaxID=2614577 RepID=A0A9P7ZM74_9HYPO|nr:uncharacterized protein F5Z01DRAFT_622174 [Emericellopsis atlantica]KAG9254272.1 hypothetical protein F5Z01DRAFT_622174 [Emericellopsis atlantica]